MSMITAWKDIKNRIPATLPLQQYVGTGLAVRRLPTGRHV